MRTSFGILITARSIWLCRDSDPSFLISWRGYWQELVETLVWAHERTPIANLLSWRDKPVALSIVQARLVGLTHFAAGFILGISYTFTKNLWFPTFFHFGWNFFQGLFGFEISGINVDSWKMISHENTGNVPDVVSGGAFGIEGSVITLSCTIICTYFIFKYYNELEK